MRKVMTGLVASVALAGLLASSGCGWLFPEKRQTPVLSMFIDVPVPPELTIDEKDSQVYEHPIGRVGVMRTSGRISKEAVLSYYREAMAQKGWQKISEFDNGEGQIMIFNKSPRSTAISITDGWLTTNVEINVTAKETPQPGQVQ